MKPNENERVVLDDMGVFLFWESYLAGLKSKDESWRWRIACEYAKKIGQDTEIGRRNVYLRMERRFKEYSKLGLFDEFVCNGDKKIYCLRLTDITFKKIKFSDGKYKRAIVIRIDD